MFTEAERVALAGLAGHNGLTRDAYAHWLRQHAAWSQGRGLHLLTARRPDIECFGIDTKARVPMSAIRGGIARRTTTRYDRAQKSLDQHATYIVAAYLVVAAC